MLNGIQHFLQFVNDNWTGIIIIISLIIAIIQKAKSYFTKSNEEKIEVAKTQVKEIILKLISDAEIDYITWNKAGSIKRAQVIKQIFSDYPVLAKVTNQDEAIKWIDTIINDSLKTLREIVTENKEAILPQQEIVVAEAPEDTENKITNTKEGA